MPTREEIYDMLPKVQCKGLCWHECSVIPVTRGERVVLPFAPGTARFKLPLTMAEQKKAREANFPGASTLSLTHMGGTYEESRSGQFHKCQFLNDRMRCDVYDKRPLICRAYGAVQTLLCPHGCKPDRVMTIMEMGHLYDLLEEYEKEQGY